MLLVLMRHAEAASGSPDHARTLTPMGRQQASVRGTQLAPFDFDCALVSDAARAVETFTSLSLDIASVRYEHEIYSGSAETIVDLVRELPDTSQSVLVVGHEPTISQAAALLAHTSPRVHEVRTGVSTATAIAIEFEDWSGPGDIVDVFR